MVEFALVVPFFFLLVCTLMDFGRLFFVQMSAEEAVQEAGRFASTGNTMANPADPNQQLTRIQSITQVVENSAFLDPSSTNVQVSSLAGGVGNAGGPNDTVTVSLTTNLPLMTPMVAAFFPNGIYTFTSSATFRNEPFPSSS
jgi:Flp pilus assembly protein TadG